MDYAMIDFLHFFYSNLDVVTLRALFSDWQGASAGRDAGAGGAR